MRYRDFVAAGVAVLFGLGLLAVTGCGGSTGGGSGPTTPTVTVSASPSSITTAQSTTVTVTVSGSSGTATGTVTLSSGTYSSGAVSLSGGSAQITIAAGSLATGSDTLTATYSSTSSSYNNASGTGSVTVTSTTLITPTVAVSPNPSSITTAQSTTVTVTVSSTGNPTPTGSVKLSSGTYNSGTVSLTSGSAQITVPAGSLATGSDTLTANYTPDTNSSSTYNSATGTGSVTVTAPTMITPTVTVSPNPSSITTSQSTTVTVTVSSTGNPTPTGSVTLTSGSYSSGAVSLTSGSAQITIAAGSLATGTDTLTVQYTPDTNSSTTYNNATGTGSVTVTAVPTLITPTVTVSANPSSISGSESTTVTVTVSSSGNPTPTGSVTLTSGSYSSGTVTLSNGSAQITASTSTLPAGNDLLTAKYTPDANSSSTYNSASGLGEISSNPSLSITSFTASPNPIQVGSSSTNLTAVFTGGTGIITPGPISVTSGKAVSVSPTTTTVYSLTVTPTSGSAITQTLTVTLNSGVTVNPSSTGVAVTSQILGMNLAYWYDVVSNASAINNAFGQAGIKAIRWPGGSDSDIYHWGYQSGSSALAEPYTCTCSPTNPDQCTADSKGWAGYSTFAQFVSAIPLAGSYDLALTANYGTNETCTGGGDPTEAAAWVAAAANDGVTVSRMTVGNEDYGSWETDLHSTPNDPTIYAAAVKGSSGYYELIKAASSGTLAGVIVDADGASNGWDSTVLGNAVGCNGAGTPCYDFVEYHYYPQYGNVTSDTFLVHQAAPEFTININTVKTELNNAGEPNTPIYVGELGANSSNPGTQSWSITQGLYAGQILGEAMNDGISRLTWWIGFGNCLGAGNNSSLLYGWQNTWGAYNVFSDGPSDTGCPGAGPIGTMSPTAIAFQLFSNVVVNGEHVLTPTVVGDTINVRAYAATHSSGTQTALVLFNLDEYASAPVTVTLTGKSTSSDVQVTTYSKAIYDFSQNDQWDPATTTDMGSQSLPLTLTLAPWSMNVVIIK